MNVTIDREEDILLLPLILGGKDEARQAGSARHGLRITRGGNFEETGGMEDYEDSGKASQGQGIRGFGFDEARFSS